MARRVALACLSVFLFATAWAGGPYPATIKVLIADGIANANLEVAGRHRVTDPASGKAVGGSLFRKAALIEAAGSGIRWGEEYPGVYQITVTPGSDSTTVLVDGVQYQGILHVYAIGERLSIVNEVSCEEYCKSVLASQLEGPLAEESLEALAIAARTHAFFDVAHRRGAFWHVKAGDVGYRGHAAVYGAPEINAAVEDTENMILESRDENGDVFPAVWTADCAGRTAPYQVIFRRFVGAETPGVESPFAAHHRAASRWTSAVPRGHLAHLLRLSDITKIELYADPFSGKVYALRAYNGEAAKEIDFLSLRKALGGQNLRSSDFVVELEGSQVIFDGHGEGHGVGVCLYSSEEMVARGQTASQILGAFYPTASVSIATMQQPGAKRGFFSWLRGAFRR